MHLDQVLKMKSRSSGTHNKNITLYFNKIWSILKNPGINTFFFIIEEHCLISQNNLLQNWILLKGI